MAKFTKTFFNFDKEVYDSESGNFLIPNLEEEKEKLNNWVNEETLKIENEEDLDSKAYYTSSYLSESKKRQDEIKNKKSELTKTHLKQIHSELDELNNMLKDIDEQEKKLVGDELAKAGKVNEFYVSPAFSIRTSPTTKIEDIQLAITFLNELGFETKIYEDNKQVKSIEDVKLKQEDARQNHAKGYFNEDDGNDFDDGRSA